MSTHKRRKRREALQDMAAENVALREALSDYLKEAGRDPAPIVGFLRYRAEIIRWFEQRGCWCLPGAPRLHRPGCEVGVIIDAISTGRMPEESTETPAWAVAESMVTGLAAWLPAEPPQPGLPGYVEGDDDAT